MTGRALTPAEYQRRYRRRQREGKRVVPVEIDAALIEDGLVARGFLAPANADDTVKVAAAFREAVAALIAPPAEPDDCVNLNAAPFRLGVACDKTHRRGEDSDVEG